MSRTLKIVGIGIGTIVGLVVIALTVIPWVVNVDQYRPQLVEMVNRKLNGKFEIGKLSLSLWGRIHVDIQGLKVLDSNDQPVLSVDDAFFDFPLISILSGSPSISLKMQKPMVHMIKSPLGTLNLATLLKTTDLTTADKNQSRNINLPAIVVHSIVTIELNQVLLTYQDEKNGIRTQVKDLNLAIRDISLSRTTALEVWANLDHQLGKNLTIRGPFRLNGQLNPVLSGSRLESVHLKAKIDLDQTEIHLGELLEKNAGVPIHADLDLNATEKELVIERFDSEVFNVQLKSQGKISNLSEVSFFIQSNLIDFKPWAQWIPLLKQYQLGGGATLEAKVEGPSNQLRYQALLKVDAVTAQAPKLKTQPQINGFVKVVTDQIEDFSFTLKAPQNDLSIHGKLTSFSQPHGIFELTSQGMDLDQLIEFPKATSVEGIRALPSGAPQVTQVSEVDYDSLLAPLRENPIAQAADIQVKVNIPSLKAYQVQMSDLAGSFLYRQGVASVDRFRMKIWNGTLQADASVQLKEKMPTYLFSTQVKNLSLKEAVASQTHFVAKMLKDTLLGKAGFELKGQGKSFNPSVALEKLNAQGKFKVEEASFSTIHVGKIAVEALNQGIEKLTHQIPSLKEKKIKALPEFQAAFDVISSDFSITGNQFKAPNFTAKAAHNRGFNLNGSIILGMKERTIRAAWELSDPYNLTHARDISIDKDGIQVEHLLAEGNQPVKVLVHIDCTLATPCYSYQEVPEYLGKIALMNLTGAVKGKAKAEVKKKIESIVEKAPQNLPPQVQQKIEDIGKKLFGR